MCNHPGLTSSVRGIPCCPMQVSGRAHCMAARCASLHHFDLAAHPSTGVLDRLTRSRVLRLSRLEKVKNVLCARCRPKCEEVVIGVGEGPAAADRHEPRVSNLRKDHDGTSICDGPQGQGRGATGHSATFPPRTTLAAELRPR